MNDLKRWIERLENWSRDQGLDFYEQKFVLYGKERMLESMVHFGGYKLYRLWNFGKQFAVNKELLERDFFFLPNEMVINTDPCKAFLLNSNSLVQNIVIAEHVFAHNDFFKNNFVFRKTDPRSIGAKLEKYNSLLEKCFGNGEIGFLKVEETLEAAHSVMFLSANEETLLDFIFKNATWLATWKKEILEGMKLFADHIMPNMRVKIMNEGWATYWHHKMLVELSNELKGQLSYSDYFQGHLMHNKVIRMPANPLEINPYRVGFFTWQKIAEERGEDFIFKVRREKTDFNFLLDYFYNQFDFIYEKFVYYSFVLPKLQQYPGAKPYQVLRDGEAEEKCREYQDLVMNAMRDSMRPQFSVFMRHEEGKRKLILNHRFNNQFLKRDYIYGALKLISRLWEGPVVLYTKLKNRIKDNKEELKNCTFECDGDSFKSSSSKIM